jgi:ATP-dependent DNA helicase DinG
MSLKQDLDRYIPRKEQIDCLDFIKKTTSLNPDLKFFLLNLPVGSGKSHLALMIADWYQKNVNSKSKFDIITNSKVLQNQYTNTYGSINDLKGKENYRCEKYDSTCQQGGEFNRLNKSICEFCPHSYARDQFLFGKISLTNFYLYILYQLYKPEAMDARGSNVLIVDECHEFEDVMSDFISIKITDTLVKKYKFQNSDEISKKLKSIKSLDDYVNFLKDFKVDVETTYGDIQNALGVIDRTPIGDKRNNKLGKIFGSKNPDLKLMQMLVDLEQLKSKIEIFLKEWVEDPNNWVMETQYNTKTKQNEMSIEPIWAFSYLDKYVFSNYDMVFLMSGTILNKDMFCKLNGLDSSKSVYYSIPSPFPIKNRPIYYIPVGKMSYDKKADTFKDFVPVINKILKKYEDKKGIIHTNSFELASWIDRDIKNPRLVYHDSSNKDEVLEKHFINRNPTVLVSPSMDTGISFDGDKARFQIISKVPYPSLASQKNKMRKQNYPEWYAYKTVSGIIQAYGRIIRSETDSGDTIIIDASFGDVLRYSSSFIPTWVQNSIKKIDVPNKV